MIGPAQVAARVLEASTLSRFYPLFSTRLAYITHPIGACVIGIFGAALRRHLHCCTVPATVSSPSRVERFHWQFWPGKLRLPARSHRRTLALAQALAPLGFGLLIEPMGRGIVAVSSLLSLATLIALMALSKFSEKAKQAEACSTY